MPSAMSGENIKLTHPLCHELWKMVLSLLFSYTISDSDSLYMHGKTLSTTNVAKARNHIKRWELLLHLVHAISYVW